MDYFKYKFYMLNSLERREYLTRREYANLCTRYGMPGSRRVITDKRLFADIYSDYMRREVLAVRGQKTVSLYRAMCDRYPFLIYKPVKGGYGKGIRVFATKDAAVCVEVEKEMIENGGLVEEYICQDEKLAAFHPDSVNTIRSVTTLSADGKITLAAAAVRTGRSGRSVDNASEGGGLFANIDLKTGEITGNATNHFCARYDKHPDTGIQFAGTVIPCWEEFKEISEKAALQQRGIRLCCWDWALNSAEQWDLIEGNLSGGIGLNQAAAGKGLKMKVMMGLGINEFVERTV